jgi:hypothetical protein
LSVPVLCGTLQWSIEYSGLSLSPEIRRPGSRVQSWGRSISALVPEEDPTNCATSSSSLDAQDAPRPIANAVKLLLLREEAKKRQGAQTDLSQTLRSNDHNVSGGVDAIAGRLMGVSERQMCEGLKARMDAQKRGRKVRGNGQKPLWVSVSPVPSVPQIQSL